MKEVHGLILIKSKSSKCQMPNMSMSNVTTVKTFKKRLAKETKEKIDRNNRECYRPHRSYLNPNQPLGKSASKDFQKFASIIQLQHTKGIL